IAEPDSCGQPLVDDSFLLLLNAYWEPMEFRLPDATFGERWTPLIDTSEVQDTPDETEHKAGTALLVERRSLVLLSGPSRQQA
ncbi:glycogen debranching enzyme, partial [Streptomyces sp. NPDC006356]